MLAQRGQQAAHLLMLLIRLPHEQHVPQYLGGPALAIHILPAAAGRLADDLADPVGVVAFVQQITDVVRLRQHPFQGNLRRGDVQDIVVHVPGQAQRTKAVQQQIDRCVAQCVGDRFSQRDPLAGKRTVVDQHGDLLFVPQPGNDLAQRRIAKLDGHFLGEHRGDQGRRVDRFGFVGDFNDLHGLGGRCLRRRGLLRGLLIRLHSSDVGSQPDAQCPTDETKDKLSLHRCFPLLQWIGVALPGQ